MYNTLILVDIRNSFKTQFIPLSFALAQVQIFYPLSSFSPTLCLFAVDFSGNLPVQPLLISAVPVVPTPLGCWTAPAGCITSWPI